VYSLDRKKAQANEDLIGGMCFLGQNPIRVLFDCGATCSFISFQCVEALQLTVTARFLLVLFYYLFMCVIRALM
jgi:hypothetical protein